MSNLFLKVIGGSGSGDTEYRILKAAAFFQTTNSYYSPTVILDKPFQHG